MELVGEVEAKVILSEVEGYAMGFGLLVEKVGKDEGLNKG